MKTKNIYKLILLGLFCIGTFQDSYAQKITWKETLDKLVNEQVTESKIHLDGYAYSGKIETEAQRKKLIEDLFSDEALIAISFFNPYANDVVSIRTKRKMDELEGKGNDLDGLKEKVNKLIKVGHEVVNVTWSINNSIYHAPCIVSDEDGGIIYDSIGMFVVKGTNTVNNKQNN